MIHFITEWLFDFVTESFPNDTDFLFTKIILLFKSNLLGIFHPNSKLILIYSPTWFISLLNRSGTKLFFFSQKWFYTLRATYLAFFTRILKLFWTIHLNGSFHNWTILIFNYWIVRERNSFFFAKMILLSKSDQFEYIRHLSFANESFFNESKYYLRIFFVF